MRPKFDLKLCLFCMSITMVIALIVKVCGSDYFLIEPNINWLQSFTNFISIHGLKPFYAGIWLHFNITIGILICSNNYSKKAILTTIVLLPASIATSMSYIQIIPLMTIMGFGLILKKHSAKGVCIRFLEVVVISALYQWLSMMIKLDILTVNVISTGLVENTLLCFDYGVFLIILLLFYKEGGNDYVVNTIFRFIKRRFVRQGKSNDQESPRIAKPDKIIYVVVQVLQLLAICIATSLNGKFIVFLFMYFLGFLPQRTSKQSTIIYHAKDLLTCFIQSVVFFYVVCATIPSMQFTLLLAPIMGALFSLATSLLAYKFKTPSDLDNLNLTDVRKLIVRCNVDEVSQAVMYAFWAEHKPISAISQELGISELELIAMRENYEAILENQMKQDVDSRTLI